MNLINRRGAKEKTRLKFNQLHKQAWWNYFFSSSHLPLTIIYFGILVRVVQYLYNRSLWNDEAALALNIVHRSYAELLQPLDYDQGAPIGFLMVEKLMVQLLGNNEYALRLFPLIAAIVSLFLFYRLAKTYLRSPAISIAVALFSTLHILLYYASEVKQYASDVMFAVLACLLFTHLEKRLSISKIALYGVLGAMIIWFSHPVIFVLASVSISCLLSSIRKPLATTFKLLTVFAIWGASFGCFYLISLKHLSTQADLINSWASRGTFPTSLLDINWLVTTFVEFFHKPLGFPDVFLSLAIIAFFVGAFCLYNKLLILGLPIIITFVAAYLHKYPFDGRLVLFLTPFFILLISEGAASIWQKTTGKRRISKISILFLILLVVPPVGTAGYLLFNPYLKQEIKPVIAYVKAHQQPKDIIYVYQRAEYQFRYYADKFGYRDGDYIIGIDDLDKKDGQGISPEEWQRYTSDLDKLRGNRIWIIFSHVRSWAQESERITAYLDTFGKQIGKFETKGSFVYLYDLTRT